MPDEPKVRISRPPRQTFGNHCFAILELYVRCEFKKKPITTFLVAYSKEPNELQWQEEARTEICENTKYPNYRQWNYRIPGYAGTDSLKFDFSLESLRLVRIEAYKTRDVDDVLNLSGQSYLGCAETELSQLLLLQSVGDGYVTMQLNNPLKREEDLGSIVFLCREEFHSKQLANLTIKGKKIRKGNFWKWGADPYYVLNRTKESSGSSVGRRNGRVTALNLDKPGPIRDPIIRSEVGKRTSAPQWEKINIPVPVLCHARKASLIEIEVNDWMRVEQDQLVGRACFTYEDMDQAFRDSKPLILQLGMPSRACCSSGCCSCRRKEDKDLLNKLQESIAEQIGDHTAMIGKKPSKGYMPVSGTKTGSLSIDVQIGRYFSFYDYVRGGLELRLVVGIDFTRSNEGPASLSSLHRWGGDGPNDYVATLQMVGEVVQKYDLEKKHAAYGFGAKLPPSYPASISSCFALTGDFFSPRVDRIEGLVDAYKRALRVVFLHGPSRMRDVIKIAIDWANGSKDVHQVNDNGVDMRYWVSLILTDGDIVDKAECMHEMLQASNLPISFLIVGIGDSDFTWFRQLNDDIQESQRAANKTHQDTVIERKIVHFARFNDFRGKAPHEFGDVLMADLPGVAITYFQCLGIKPWNVQKYEAPSGQLHSVPIVDHTHEDMLKKQKNKRDVRPTAKAAADNSSEMLRMRNQKLPTKDVGSGLPTFLNECKESLIDEALDYGYSKVMIEKVLKDGIAAGNIEALLDTILHGGYGKRPIFKSLAEEVDFEKLAQDEAKKSCLQLTALADVKAPPGQPAILPPVRRGKGGTKMLGDGGENFNNDPSRTLSNLKNSASPNSGMSDNIIDLPGVVHDESQIVIEVCKICRFRSIDTEFIPCGHRVACRYCAEQSFQANGHVCSYCGKSVTEALQFVGSDDQLE